MVGAALASSRNHDRRAAFHPGIIGNVRAVSRFYSTLFMLVRFAKASGNCDEPIRWPERTSDWPTSKDRGVLLQAQGFGAESGNRSAVDEESDVDVMVRQAHQVAGREVVVEERREDLGVGRPTRKVIRVPTLPRVASRTPGSSCARYRFARTRCTPYFRSSASMFATARL